MYDSGIFITWNFPCLHLCVDYKDGCVMNDAFLAVKAESLGMLDAMLSEGWEAAHPVEAAERGSFIMQVGLCIRRFGRRGDGSPASEEPKVCWRMSGFVSSQAFCRGRAG